MQIEVDKLNFKDHDEYKGFVLVTAYRLHEGKFIYRTKAQSTRASEEDITFDSQYHKSSETSMNYVRKLIRKYRGVES